MPVYKILLIVCFYFISCVSVAIAQSALGTTTYLLHPSGIPATVTTTQDGTVTNVDGKDVSTTEDTDQKAHEDAVNALVRGGFRLQRSSSSG